MILKEFDDSVYVTVFFLLCFYDIILQKRSQLHQQIERI